MHAAHTSVKRRAFAWVYIYAKCVVVLTVPLMFTTKNDAAGGVDWVRSKSYEIQLLPAENVYDVYTIQYKLSYMSAEKPQMERTT